MKIRCVLATVRQIRAEIAIARMSVFFKYDSRCFVEGTVPDPGLNSSVTRRYNFFSPRPRVVFFHLFLRGSRAAFFFTKININ
ncbi:hypothetical protein [Paraburkholderia lycopersici]|uniref:hypothetical protein n=1 Tax=Paraburkholderia lycopersici TaxID=416944 RepID=UPI0011612DF1|nr:hypothetical protein [Paraburkholderia lycopersici]